MKKTKKELIRFMKENHLVARGKIGLAEHCLKNFLTKNVFYTGYSAWNEFLRYVESSKGSMESVRHLRGYVYTTLEASKIQSRKNPKPVQLPLTNKEHLEQHQQFMRDMVVKEEAQEEKDEQVVEEWRKKQKGA